MCDDAGILERTENNEMSNFTPRRVVTGHDAQGKSVFISDGSPPRQPVIATGGGIRFAEMWATDSAPAHPASSEDPTPGMTSLTPPPGGTRFRLTELPPAAEGELNPAAFLAEVREKAPGDWNLEAENPGMHTTETVDYGVVISGRVWLELDDGAMTELGPGDCVVQNGTRHAWRNTSGESCWMAFVMVGATR